MLLTQDPDPHFCGNAFATSRRRGQYGFVEAAVAGLNGGVGGGPSLQAKVLFYVGVDDVGTALEQAEALGGCRVFGPDGVPGKVVVGQFTDPEGNLIGVAGQK